jgi:uncharacterized DUF497 family protein
VKQYTWDEKKNQKLIQERGVSFEDVVQAIAEEHLLDITTHHNTGKYPGQYQLVVQMVDYVYLVPYEELDDKIRLITIIPSRKARKKYSPGGES